VTEQPVFTDLGFSDSEWGLLVGLPQAVVLAASAVEHDSVRRTVAENAAGMEAIADARQSASPLVNAIATEVVARLGDPGEAEEVPGIEPELPFIEAGDTQAVIADVLERSHAAAVLLAQRTDEGEAGAYKHWLVTIADQVVSAATSGGVLGIGGTTVSDAERSFRDELSHVLND
jgi:hypothetical protein